MGGSIIDSSVGSFLGSTLLGYNPHDIRAEQDRQRVEAERKANEQAAKLAEQQKAIDAQKKAEQDELNARKKRMVQAESGTSGLLNLNPEKQSSILG